MGNRPVLLIKHPPIASHDSGNGTWIIDGDEKQISKQRWIWGSCYYCFDAYFLSFFTCKGQYVFPAFICLSLC